MRRDYAIRASRRAELRAGGLGSCSDLLMEGAELWQSTGLELGIPLEAKFA